MNHSESLKELATALAKAQGELENPEKNQKGYGYKYADLSSIIDQTKPVLEKNGLVVTQLPIDDGNGRVGVETLLMHSSGEYISSRLTLPIPEMKGTTATQAAGAALTYARRYSLCAVLNINADEDTDAAGDTKSKKISAFQKESTQSQKKDGCTCGTSGAYHAKNCPLFIQK